MWYTLMNTYNIEENFFELVKLQYLIFILYIISIFFIKYTKIFNLINQ